MTGLLAFAALFMATSCEEDEITMINATGVSLSSSTLSIVDGDVVELAATVTPADATSKYMAWTSSDTGVATVDNFGRVCAIEPGTAVITVTTDDGGFTASCTVTVTPKRVTGVTLDQTAATVYETESITLTATVNPTDATDKAVVWSSSDEAIATVDQSGKVSGISYGDATITVTTVDGGHTASCVVSVELIVPTEPETLDFWRASDRSGYRAIYAPGEADKTVDGWLNFSDGVVTWDENTTGSPRSATMEFASGSSITITQVGPEDFLGEWTVKASLFDLQNLFGGRQNRYEGKVTFTEPLKGETLTDENGDEYTNNIGIHGLYRNAILDACVDIDYDAKTLRFGLFFDRREAQDAGDGYYCIFIPECTGGTSWGSYNFAPKDFSDTDYAWLWMTAEDFYNMTYFFPSGAQPIGKYYCCGISIVSGDSAEACLASSSYCTIYQANYGTQDTGGLSFYK